MNPQDLKKLAQPFKGWFCWHKFTNPVTVSGFGYTEYHIWFCKKCPKVFGYQSKNYNE